MEYLWQRERAGAGNVVGELWARAIVSDNGIADDELRLTAAGVDAACFGQGRAGCVGAWVGAVGQARGAGVDDGRGQ